jgi:hypothetical protein
MVTEPIDLDAMYDRYHGPLIGVLHADLAVLGRHAVTGVPALTNELLELRGLLPAVVDQLECFCGSSLVGDCAACKVRAYLAALNREGAPDA